MSNSTDSSRQNLRDEVLNLLHRLIDLSNMEPYFDVINKVKMLDRQVTLDALRELLHHTEAELRFRAGEVLLQIDAEATQTDVILLLKDVDVHIRSGIAYLLYEYGDQRAVELLIDLLLHDSDDDVRSNAALALGGIGDERAVSALKWVIAHDDGSNFQDEPIKNTAARAIEQIRNPPQLP